MLQAKFILSYMHLNIYKYAEKAPFLNFILSMMKQAQNPKEKTIVFTHH